MTTQPQLDAMHEALSLLDRACAPAALDVLLNAIETTPTDSPHYPVLCGCANWISPCNNPDRAKLALAGYLLDHPDERCAMATIP